MLKVVRQADAVAPQPVQMIVAVAHKLFVVAYTLIRKRERSREPGADYFDTRQQDKLLNRLRAKIEHLGYSVTLEPRAVAAD